MVLFSSRKKYLWALITTHDMNQDMEAAEAEIKETIGSRELIYLPDIRKSPLLARVDTGARTSALHCFSVNVEKINKKEVLCVRFMRNSRKVVRFPKFTKRKVKSSNGQIQQRFVVKIRMQFGERSYLTTFTLTNRADMRHAALLGRKFLRNRFVVDVSENHIVDTPKPI